VLSHKTYQNQGICYATIAYCYVTKLFVARKKIPHVKMARNTTKVGQACSRCLFNGLFQFVFHRQSDVIVDVMCCDVESPKYHLRYACSKFESLIDITTGKVNNNMNL